MDIFVRYPELKRQFVILRQKRRNEILSQMLETDDVYKELCRKRADASMTLKSMLEDSDADALLEEYSDSTYAQEIYELDSVYRQAFRDALDVLSEQGLI